jgi:transposase
VTRARGGGRRGPWARPGSRFTTAFEDTTAWLVCHATLSVVAVLLRIAWRSVSGIVTRVVAERAGATDRLAGLRRIGIDEISYKKGQRYLLVVTCHDTGRLVWAGKDRTKETLGRFFDDLGAERAAALTHVSADGAECIHTVVTVPAPRAVLCLDPFHVVAWATKALDETRRGLAAELRRGGRADEASTIKGTRWALLKNPHRLSVDQRTTLAGIQATNGPLYRATCSKILMPLRDARGLKMHQQANPPHQHLFWSQNNSVRCSKRVISPTRSACSSAGWPGPPDAASPRSSSSQRRSSASGS